MDTYAGATKALAQGGLYGFVGAAGVIAAGLANIRSILQTDVPGETGGGDDPAPPTPEVVQNTAPIVPTFGAIGTEPPPVQAFVVESDVSSSQAFLLCAFASIAHLHLSLIHCNLGLRHRPQHLL